MCHQNKKKKEKERLKAWSWIGVYLKGKENPDQSVGINSQFMSRGDTNIPPPPAKKGHPTPPEPGTETLLRKQELGAEGQETKHLDC